MRTLLCSHNTNTGNPVVTFQEWSPNLPHTHWSVGRFYWGILFRLTMTQYSLLFDHNSTPISNAYWSLYCRMLFCAQNINNFWNMCSSTCFNKFMKDCSLPFIQVTFKFIACTLTINDIGYIIPVVFKKRLNSPLYSSHF